MKHSIHNYMSHLDLYLGLVRFDLLWLSCVNHFLGRNTPIVNRITTLDGPDLIYASIDNSFNADCLDCCWRHGIGNRAIQLTLCVKEKTTGLGNTVGPDISPVNPCSASPICSSRLWLFHTELFNALVSDQLSGSKLFKPGSGVP